jgi:hypothetical protein
MYLSPIEFRAACVVALVLDLAAGDYVSCFFYSSATTDSKFYAGSSQYNNFSGFLIG